MANLSLFIEAAMPSRVPSLMLCTVKGKLRNTDCKPTGWIMDYVA